MTKIDTYKHLDADSAVTVQLDMPSIAKQVCALNYGAHRLLSAMVHELREKQRAYVKGRIEFYRAMPENRRIVYTAADEISPLADAIETALNLGHTA